MPNGPSKRTPRGSHGGIAGIRAKMRIAAIYITTGNAPDDLNQEDRLTLGALADAERLLTG